MEYITRSALAFYVEISNFISEKGFKVFKISKCKNHVDVTLIILHYFLMILLHWLASIDFLQKNYFRAGHFDIRNKSVIVFNIV